MKTLITIMLALGITTGASAQKLVRGGGFHHVAPRISIGLGTPFYPYYYGPAFGPWYYGYPYYGAPNYRHSSRLDRQITDINNEYHAKIEAARSDKSVPRSERRHHVKELKVERAKAIADARQAYYAPHAQKDQHNYNK